LLFLPLLFQYFKKNKNELPSEEKSENLNLSTLNLKKLIGFYAIIGWTTLLLFMPFYSSEFINNYSKTVGLWFSTFEFNASLYYIARQIGYVLTSYNQIGLIGKFIPILTILIVISLTFIRKNTTTAQLITNMLLAITLYYFISTTVHPWYLATLLILSVFTNYKFPLVWSFVIILSYLAYSTTQNTENFWVIGLEYLIVYSVFIWEVAIKKDHQKAVS